jgi:hypothetical protein
MKQTVRTKRPTSSDPKEWAAYVSSIPVNKHDILKIVNELNIRRQGGKRKDFELTVVLCFRSFRSQDKSFAVSERMNALAHLLIEQEHAVRGWTTQLPDGTTFTQENVFAAAAAHPLVAHDDKFRFEPESFLRRVLELAPVVGRASRSKKPD